VQPGFVWHATELQVIPVHDAVGPHVTSHAHELPHEMLFAHELMPVQTTEQEPGPQATLRHVPEPLHSILQSSAAMQLTPLRHELAVSHLTEQ
jgi:hypothetical protein